MKPELIEAIERLEAQRLVPPEKIRLLQRTALGDLVSVRLELRTLIYAGVTAATWALLRSLSRRPEGEWRGFTAKALFDRSSADATQMAALTAFVAPQSATTQADFEGGGGASGGGGATGAYGPGPGKPSG